MTVFETIKQIRQQPRGTLRKTTAKQALCLLFAMALLFCTGCSLNPMHQEGPHTRHPIVSDDQFTGVPVPPAATLRPKTEITQTTITAEDVLAALDQWAQVSLHYFWQGAKERWGEEFYNITATFNSICPHTFSDIDTTAPDAEQIGRQCAYYNSESLFDGTSYWQSEPITYEEPIWPVTVKIDLGLQGEIFEGGEFYPMGIAESEFLPIAQAMGLEPFQITKEILMDLYDLPAGYLSTSLNHGHIAYPAFTLDRESILAIEDQNLLWALYSAIHGSLYSINLRNHYQTYGDLTVIP